MTTTFFDRDHLGDLAIDNFADTDAVWLTINSRGGHLTIKGRRSKFLAAVATEFDVLVIPRTDLPPVDPEANGRGVGVGGEYIEADDAPDARTVALRYLAVAEYLDAHPPIDQAQVDALARLLAEDDGAVSWQSYTDGARRLIATGRITVTPDGGAS